MTSERCVKSVLPFKKGQIYSHLSLQPTFNVEREKIISTHCMIEKLFWDMTKKKMQTSARLHFSATVSAVSVWGLFHILHRNETWVI